MRGCTYVYIHIYIHVDMDVWEERVKLFRVMVVLRDIGWGRRERRPVGVRSREDISWLPILLSCRT